MLVYLHGFASSPGSAKARHFHRGLAALGEPLVVPALDGGDFSHLTLTGQLAVLEDACAGASGPLVLIGSSMGGYLSALYAATHDVAALVLMAPAVDFAARWRERLGPEAVAAWRESGSMPVHHYGAGRELPLHYGLLADAERHEPWPKVRAPTLVLHGRRDDVVPQDRVEHWVQQTPNAELVLYDDGHELTASVDAIFAAACRFLTQIPAVSAAHPGLRGG